MTSASARPPIRALIPAARKNWKEALVTVLGGVAIGASIGLVLGGASAYTKINERATLTQLTSNPSLVIEELMQDEGFTTHFSRIVSFRTFNPVAFDSALFHANTLLKLRDRLNKDYADQNAMVENLPIEAEERYIQLSRSLSAIETIVTRENGYMTRDFNDGAADVMARARGVITNMNADVRDRKSRPMV